MTKEQYARLAAARERQLQTKDLTDRWVKQSLEDIVAGLLERAADR